MNYYAAVSLFIPANVMPIRLQGLKYTVKEVKAMKKVLKKATAFVMAFTLLGTGTALSKKISPDTQTTLTASATSCTNCHGGSWWVSTTSLQVGLHLTVYYHTCGLCGRHWTTTVYH